MKVSNGRVRMCTYTWQEETNDLVVNYEITITDGTRGRTCKFYARWLGTSHAPRDYFPRDRARDGQQSRIFVEKLTEATAETSCVDRKNWLGHPRGNRWTNTMKQRGSLAFGFKTSLSCLTDFHTRYPDLETHRVRDRNQLDQLTNYSTWEN